MEQYKYCKNCHIKVTEAVDNCPLCTQHLYGEMAEGSRTYPKVQIQLKKLSRLRIALIASQILLVLAITVSAILRGHTAWFLVTGGGIIYAVFSVAQSVRAKESPGFMIMKQILLICVLGFAIDYFNDFTRWSTNYMIPVLLTIGSFVITMIILVRPTWFKDYFVYEITLLVFCVLSLLMRLFGLSTVGWTATLAAIYSLITMLGLIVFAGRKTKLELKKRLHV